MVGLPSPAMDVTCVKISSFKEHNLAKKRKKVKMENLGKQSDTSNYNNVLYNNVRC